MTSAHFFKFLTSKMNGSNESFIAFLREICLLKRTIHCNFCQSMMKEYKSSKNQDGFVFKCIDKECIKFKKTKSIRSGSFFSVASCR